MSDWFHQLYEGRERFEDPEEEAAYREKQRALTQPEVKGLFDLLELPLGSLVLDAYCGNGRHAAALAVKGFRVIGLDIAFSRVVFAHRWAEAERLDARFSIGDVSTLGLQAVFDGVVILGGSFTHCLDENENVRLLKGFRDVLKPGGRFLIDNPNPIRFWQLQNPDGAEDEKRALPYFDLPLGTGESTGKVRYYSADNMAVLFQKAGFDAVRVFGATDRRRYDIDSPRLVALGKNPE